MVLLSKFRIDVRGSQETRAMGSYRWTIAEYVGMKDFPRNSPVVWPRISIWQKVTGKAKKPYEIRLRPDPVERFGISRRAIACSGWLEVATVGDGDCGRRCDIGVATKPRLPQTRLNHRFVGLG